MSEVYLMAFQTFLKDLGIDLSKWDMEGDVETFDYSDEDECRELSYRSKVNGEYTIYAVLQNFQSEWMVIEFSINGD